MKHCAIKFVLHFKMLTSVLSDKKQLVKVSVFSHKEHEQGSAVNLFISASFVLPMSYQISFRGGVYDSYCHSPSAHKMFWLQFQGAFVLSIFQSSIHDKHCMDQVAKLLI